MGTIVLRAPDGQVTNIDCLSCQQPGVQSVAFNGSGTQLVSGGIDNTVRLWDTATGTQIQSALSGQTEDTRAVAISDNGKLIVSASDDKTVRIWLSPALQRTFEPMKGYDVKSVDDHLVAFSPDTARFAAVTHNGQFRVWASDGGQLLKTVSTGHARLGGIGFDSAGDIATVSDDGAVELWAAQGNYAKPTEVGRLGDSGHSVGVSRDGTRVVAGGGRSLMVWTPGTAPLRITTPAEVTSVAFSRDGALVAYGTGDGKLQAIRVADGKPLFAEPQQADSGDSSHFTNVAAVAFSPDGTRLAAGAKGDDKVRLWNLRTGKGFEMKGHHEGDVVDVDFTGDGRYVVSAGYDDTVQLWDADTGQRVGTPLFDEHGDVTAIGVTSDDMIIRASRREGVVSNWPGPAIWQPALCRKLSYNMNHAQWQSWVKLPEGQYLRACDQLQEIPDGWSAP
jgi:WD40 repeat protein